jgi:hypothetical protein
MRIRATSCKVKQMNGFEFTYGIELNIKGLFIPCVHVQPSFETEHEDLRKSYITTINSFKKKNEAIDFINEEIEMGYLSANELRVSE